MIGPYSPECVEGRFSEVRISTILRTSPQKWPPGGCADLRKLASVMELADTGAGVRYTLPLPLYTERVLLMKRILVLITAALVMAAVMLAMAFPAFAAPRGLA